MTLVNPYCSVKDVRDQLGDAGDKLDVSLIEKAINATSRAVDRHCGYPLRRFWLDATVTARRYRCDDPEVASVADIGSTAGLIIRTDTNGDGTWSTTWSATDYQLEPLDADVAGDDAYAWWRIVAIGVHRFPVYRRRVSLQVTARHGWSAIPDDVNEAAILKAVSLFKRKDAPFGVAGFGEFGAVRITRRDPDVIELLGNYTRLTVEAV